MIAELQAGCLERDTEEAIEQVEVTPSPSKRGYKSLQQRSCCYVLIHGGLLCLAMSAAIGALWVPVLMLQRFPYSGMLLAVGCPFSSLMLYLAPCGAVREALKNRNAESIPIHILVVQAAASVLAIDYGLKVKNGTVVITNVIGVALQIMWLSSHHYISKRNTRWLSFVFTVFISVSTVFYGCSFVTDNTVGFALCGVNLLLFGTPMLHARTILETQSEAGTSATLAIMMTLTNACWAIFGYLEDDLIVWLPSVLGYVLSVFQVFLISWCRNKLPIDLKILTIFFPSTGKYVTLPSAGIETKVHPKSPHHVMERHAARGEVSVNTVLKSDV